MDCLRGGVVRNGEPVPGHELPDEGAEFACDGDDDFLFTFATRFEPDITFVEPVLHTPGDRFDVFGLAFLAFAQRPTDLWGFAVVLGTFDKHPSGVAVTAFGDRALAPF